MNRPIDVALQGNRPAKQAVRNLWVEEVRRYSQNPDAPLYVTLSGALGLDISAILEDGLVRLTETGAIHPDDQLKLVAIEYDAEAVLSLQKKFPGLTIVEQTLEAALSGPSAYAWPPNSMRAKLRGRVVNLDFNQSIQGKADGGKPQFDLVTFIKKISHLHAVPPQQVERKPWTLCLTINASCNWDAHLWRSVTDYLRANYMTQDNFREKFDEFLSRDAGLKIANDANFSLQTADQTQLDKIFSILLPKVIIDELNDHNWSASSAWIYSYGEQPLEAPMLTLAIRFEPNQGALTSGERYARNLEGVTKLLGRIQNDGQLI